MRTRIRMFLRRMFTPWARAVLILLGLVGVGILTRQLFLPSPTVPLTELQPLSLAGYHRLLILAPHCDDETLASAGMILAAERAGIQVRVVIATNGDGYLFATMQDFRKVYPTHSDFIHFGELRQQESLAALAKLGVRPDQVTFLSYPDRGTPALWNTYWSSNVPYRSPYSGDTKSPYPLTYNPRSVYAGADLLADISAILSSYRPDLVVYPNPDDVHPDHWGLNVFSRLALTRMRHSDRSFNPMQLTYLVHRPDFPELRGYLPAAVLTPPDLLFSLDPHWFRLDLPPADVSLKGQAVQEYRSQLPLLHNLMDSFVRSNEVFAPVSTPDLAGLVQGNPLDPSTWRDASGTAIPPVQLDPVGDFFTRAVIKAGDLTAVYAARDAHENLRVCSRMVEETVPEITYLLQLKALTDEPAGILSLVATSGHARSGMIAIQRHGEFACASLPLGQLGNPWAVYLGATTVSGGRILDATGWQMVYTGNR